MIAVVKTSGGKGLHISVPLNGAKVDHDDDTKDFALALGQMLVARDKKRATVNMAKAERKGKVFIDWSQNDRHKTTICAYSLRIAERPTVSTPVTWDEVRSALEDVRPRRACTSRRRRCSSALPTASTTTRRHSPSTRTCPSCNFPAWTSTGKSRSSPERAAVSARQPRCCSPNAAARSCARRARPTPRPCRSRHDRRDRAQDRRRGRHRRRGADQPRQGRRGRAHGRGESSTSARSTCS